MKRSTEMKRSGKHWWHFRNEDLIALGKAQAPLYVYNEETLNDIFFDLSAIGVLAGVFYPYHFNPHPQVLQKAFDLHAHFRCNSLSEVNHLKRQFQDIPPERIIFLSDHARRGDCEAAVHQGIHVAVRVDDNTANACLNVSQGKNIFICMDMGDDIAPDRRSERNVKGIYICPDSRFLSLCNHDEKISLFKTLSLQFPDISTLVLGNGTNGNSSANMDGTDIPKIENYLEAIHDACPQFELQLEVPFHFVSYAGALLVEALESGTAEGIHYVRIHLPMNNAQHGEIHGTVHQVINLSKPHDEIMFMTRIIPQSKHAGNGMVYLKNPCPVEKGDMLLLTHMGAYGPETGENHKTRNGLSEWYLKARSLCRVKL